MHSCNSSLAISEQSLRKRMARSILVLCIFSFFVLQSMAAFTPTDNYLVDCGATKAGSLEDGRKFQTDAESSSLLSSSSQQILVSSSNATVPSDLYKTARVFTRQSSYTFGINQKGRHWVRLYFFPVPDQTHDLKSAVFSVTTDTYVLLHNFTFNKETQNPYLFKEYLINVDSNSLKLNFSPSNVSLAFINAIEVVSVPDTLIPDQAQTVNPSGIFKGLPGLALETVYRLNVGGPKLTSKNDTLWRSWETDQKYLDIKAAAASVHTLPSNIKYPPGVTVEIAPPMVYATAENMGNANTMNQNFNISWSFNVDPDFAYFIRMHFCDIVSKSLNQLIFNDYINSQSTLAEFDISSKAGGLAAPVYIDFVANVSAGSKVVHIEVGPPPGSYGQASNAILNGLEIMKMSNFAGSLDGNYSVYGIIGIDKY